MTADEVKEALRRRHPATAPNIAGPGPWTVLEEYLDIDLLAFAAWSSARPTVPGVGYPIVGYEVKVSRGDYRREVLRPDKRRGAVALCHAFYFATPKDLLTKEERVYVEPEHFEDQAFVRESCPAKCHRPNHYQVKQGYPRRAGRRVEVSQTVAGPYCYIAVREEIDPVADARGDGGYLPGVYPTFQWIVCETCEGRGYLRQSVVEQEAPTLWVPADVGLVEVGADCRCRVVRQAPIRHKPDNNWSIGHLVRWASYRGDPRHQTDRRTLAMVA